MGSMHQALLVGAGAAPFVGDLDAFTTDLWAVYSIKRKLSSWLGAAFKAVRSSDSATRDIGFLADGTLDVADMLAWAGTDTVTIEQWLDQTGNLRHISNGASASWPRVATGGVYDGFVRFDGSDDCLQTLSNNSTAGIPAISLAWHGQMRSNTTGMIAELGGDINTNNGFYILSLDNGGTNRLRLGVSNDSGGSGAFSVWNGTTQVLTSEAAWLVRYDRSQSTASDYAAWRRAWRDGAEETIAHVLTTASLIGTFDAAPYAIGGRASGGFPNPVNLKTVAIWESSQDSNAAGICTGVAA
jgi:hypothetical protein